MFFKILFKWCGNTKCKNDLNYIGTTGFLMLIAFIIDLIVYYEASGINLDDQQPPPTAETEPTPSLELKTITTDENHISQIGT